MQQSQLAIILLAHGSRDPLWRRPIEAVAARIQTDQPRLLVRCAYLELCAPDLAGAVAELATLGATQITIASLFLGAGRHVREDLPRMVQDLAHNCGHLQLRLQPPIGEDARMTALMADIASQSIVS